MPMNVSMNTDGFPESVLTTPNVPNQIASTNNINDFPDTSLIGTYLLCVIFEYMYMINNTYYVISYNCTDLYLYYSGTYIC